MRLSPVLGELGTYPFARLDEARRRLEEAGTRVVDFGVGDPREPTAQAIRRALADHGLPELREAIAAWVIRRFGIALDPETEIVPTLGAKEAIFSFAQVVADPAGGRDTIVTTEPGYPVAERGARFAGLRVEHLPLLERNAFLPNLDAVEPALWRRTACVWTNYPNNPTGAIAPLWLYERLAELAAQHDFVVASDEAYTELYFDGRPPISALQAGDRRRLAVFNSLSKRSSMTGYRCGFVAGSPELIAALRLYRPSVGTAPQEFVQRAAAVAWSDEEHVQVARERYGRKRAVLVEALTRKGLRVAGSVAGMYLWVEVPGGQPSEAFAERLLEHGILAAPGAYLGPSGEGYVRFALVPTEQDCRRAAAKLEEAL
jgi:succinyldiaminopimelate transaminase